MAVRWWLSDEYVRTDTDPLETSRVAYSLRQVGSMVDDEVMAQASESGPSLIPIFQKSTFHYLLFQHSPVLSDVAAG